MFKGWIARDATLAGQPSLSYIGGMRRGFTGIGNWTYPLVRLRIYEDGLELGPSVPILKALVPIWRARFEDISVAESVGGGQPDSAASFSVMAVTFSPTQRWGMMTRGVRIMAADGGFAIFWCTRRDHVLTTLQSRSVNVNSEPQPFHFFSPRS